MPPKNIPLLVKKAKITHAKHIAHAVSAEMPAVPSPVEAPMISVLAPPAKIVPTSQVPEPLPTAQIAPPVPEPARITIVKKMASATIIKRGAPAPIPVLPPLKESDTESDDDIQEPSHLDNDNDDVQGEIQGSVTIPDNQRSTVAAEDGVSIVEINGKKTEVFVENGLRIDVSEEPKIAKTGSKEDNIYVSLTPEEKEKLIDNLETKKYELKKRYKDGDGTVKAQLREVCRLLGNVKQCDVDEKVDINIQNKLAIEKDFKKKESKLKLSLSDFRKIINLMAPKEDREPDITTEQWRSSKELFKGKTYREASSEKQEKFKEKLKPKKMNERVKKDVIKRVDGNLKNIHVHTNKQEVLSYQKYDPLNFTGLYIY